MLLRRRPVRVAITLAWLALGFGLASASSDARAQNCTAPGCTISEINLWADELVEIVRGPLDIAMPELGNATYGDPSNIPGPASGVPTEAVSLGDGGSVTVRFAEVIHDGPDFDFAVFENGISSGAPGLLYMELGYVEVSSNGVDFARFPSLTSRIDPVLPLAEADPDDYANLAGHRPAGTGSEFDLADLALHPLVLAGDVDLDAIEYVRVEDVIGNGSTLDSMGSQLWDPYPTAFPGIGGFDIDAVGAIHVPEPAHTASLLCGGLVLSRLVRRRGQRPAGKG